MKIDRNIPMPTRTRSASLGKEIMENLNVGDSTLIDGDLHGTIQSYLSVTPARKGLQNKYSVLRVEGGSRVWRVL